VVASQPVAKVLIDWDSTMNDFDGHLVETLNDYFGSNYVVGDMKTWDWLRQLEPEHLQHTWGEKVYNSPTWTASIPILPGVIGGIRNLLRAGYAVRVVTARGKTHQPWVRAWLDNHRMADIPLTMADGKDKAKWAKKYGYTLAIEDAPHHVIELATVCDMVYMVDKPYNAHVGSKYHPDGLTNIVRVSSLWEATERILGARQELGHATEGRAGGTDPALLEQSHTAASGVRAGV
jgi:hypothetical protein